MDKLEAVQKVLRFSDKVREWCESENSVFFDDFDNHNVDDYDGGYGGLADQIIDKGLEEKILDDEDLAEL